MPKRLTAVLTTLALTAPLPPAHAGTGTTTPEVHPVARTATTQAATPPRDPHRVPLLALVAAVSRVAASTTTVVRKPVHHTKPKPVHRYDPLTDAPHTTAGLAEFARAAGYPWTGIIRCESWGDGSWRESAKSWARGIVQMLPSTWRSLGMSGDPAAAPWRTQLREAVILAHRDGLRHSWVCARILGYA